MKTLRNHLFGFVMMYKTSFAINPVITTVGTIVAAVFVASLAKIFGL
ncbi:membrane protein [Cronobacter phage vB_CsaM_GAP32]|uniref:Putative membrane protein n=1 Tax=Cronobacter phage vB_CsaM_GAP32 TaxID=1141136 RepID=K4F7D4_9CAUD|nr:membrane protein [Cronobacter phage vB_CsaM_GAP32]AFC21627.1 putative membrane protein [Cronobacter phage vB_CsaM_GAP32]